MNVVERSVQDAGRFRAGARQPVSPGRLLVVGSITSPFSSGAGVVRKGDKKTPHALGPPSVYTVY